MGIGEILSAAFQLYQRHRRTLLAIAAVVVVPFTLLQYLFGNQIRTRGEETANGVVVETASWAVGIAGLVTALAALLMFLVLTGAITRAVAAEVVGEDPGVEQSYRFGFHRLGSVLLVSVLVGLATVGGLILLVIPGSTSGCGWRSASRRWWWRAAAAPRRWAGPGSWSAGTGGTPLARCWWRG
jgi:hypothetical protein